MRSLVVLIASLVGVGGTAALGTWQLDRAAQKVALQDSLDQRSAMPALAASALTAGEGEVETLQHRRIGLRGLWVAQHTVFLDNRAMGGRAGFIVVTPLLLADSNIAVAVQRGWLPRDAADRTRLPPLATPAGEVEVAGRIAPPPSRLYEFSAAASGAIRQNLDLGAYGVETGLRLAPLSVLQDEQGAGSDDDGLLRQWPLPAVDVHKHYGYAFQWFALCALMAGLYVWFQLIRPRLRRSA